MASLTLSLVKSGAVAGIAAAAPVVHSVNNPITPAVLLTAVGMIVGAFIWALRLVWTAARSEAKVDKSIQRLTMTLESVETNLSRHDRHERRRGRDMARIQGRLELIETHLGLNRPGALMPLLSQLDAEEHETTTVYPLDDDEASPLEPKS